MSEEKWLKLRKCIMLVATLLVAIALLIDFLKYGREAWELVIAISLFLFCI